MAEVSKYISDATGRELAPEERIVVLYRGEKRKFDLHPDEVAQLKPLEDFIELELQMPNGDKKPLYTTKDELNKLMSPDQLAEADNSRGRRKGSSPSRPTIVKQASA